MKMRDNRLRVPSLAAGLSDLLRDLAIAWKNLASYPEGHPRRTQSLLAAQGQVERLLPHGDFLTLGVLRDGLLLGEEKITATSAQRLGEALHRRHVAIVTLGGDTSAAELETFLRLLAADPRRATVPFWDELASEGVRHITLRPIDYEGVTLGDAPAEATEAPAEASLSETLVRELLAGRGALAFGAEAGGGSLDEVVALVGALFAESEREDAAADRSGTGGPSVGGAAGGAGSGGAGFGPGGGATTGRGQPGDLRGVGGTAESGGGPGGTGSGGGMGGAGSGGVGAGGGLGSGGPGDVAGGPGSVAGGSGLATGLGSSAAGGSDEQATPAGALGGGSRGGVAGRAFGGAHATAGDAERSAGRQARTARLASDLSRVVAEFFGRARGDARVAAAGELAELVRRLPPGPRLALAEAAVRALGAPSAERGREESDGAAFEAFTSRLPPVEALDAVRRAAQGGARLSARALRLAQALEEAGAPVAPGGQASARAIAELETLFKDDDVDRVGTPPANDDRLTPLALPRARAVAPGDLPDLGPRLDTLAPAALATQLLATLLELVVDQPVRQIPAGVLARLEDLYRELLQLGRFDAAMQVIAALKSARGSEALDETTDDLRHVVERLGNRESVRAILSALRDLPDGAETEAARLIERLGAPALRHLLGLLSEEQDRSLRHRLLALLTALGPAVVPEASLLLQDSRWFVVRNMIVLLRTVGDQGSLPALRRLAQHGDLRVRLEAIKSLFAFDSQMPTELLARAIDDPDPKLAESAIGLAAAYNLAQAVPPLLALLAKSDRLGRRRAVRLRALRTLGVLGDPSMLGELDRLFLRERWFGKPNADERAAAFRALAGLTPQDRDASVERGLTSRDPAVRAICRALAEGKLRAERDTEETQA
jgi:hypothetical protein